MDANRIIKLHSDFSYVANNFKLLLDDNNCIMKIPEYSQYRDNMQICMNTIIATIVSMCEGKDFKYKVMSKENFLMPNGVILGDTPMELDRIPFGDDCDTISVIVKSKFQSMSKKMMSQPVINVFYSPYSAEAYKESDIENLIKSIQENIGERKVYIVLYCVTLNSIHQVTCQFKCINAVTGLINEFELDITDVNHGNILREIQNKVEGYNFTASKNRTDNTLLIFSHNKSIKLITVTERIRAASWTNLVGFITDENLENMGIEGQMICLISMSFMLLEDVMKVKEYLQGMCKCNNAIDVELSRSKK